MVYQLKRSGDSHPILKPLFNIGSGVFYVAVAGSALYRFISFRWEQESSNAHSVLGLLFSLFKALIGF